MEVMLYWMGFLMLSGVIFFFGSRFSHAADELAESYGIGKGWMGFVLLGVVTSLPEFMTGLSSVVWVGTLDLAAGDVFGSCVFNLFIFALLDLLDRNGILFKKAVSTHRWSVLWSMGLYGVLLVGILCPFLSQYQVGHVSFLLIGVLIYYLFALRFLFVHEHPQGKETFLKKNLSKKEKTKWMRRCVVSGVMIILAGWFLPFLAGRLIVEMGWKEAWFGTFFVAVTTSLPEVTVAISAFRRRSVDLAIGNLLGSNLFNITLLFWDDLFYRKGLFLTHISITHSWSAFFALLMTAVIGGALLYPPSKKGWTLFRWPAWLLVFLYLGRLMIA